MNSKTVGNISEASILAYLLKLGYNVSIPFGNNARYDMILDDGKSLLKIQCKTGKYKKGCITFSTTSVNGFTSKKRNYIGDIDIFIVYCPLLESIYKIPIEKAPKGGSMMLRIDEPKKFSPISSINWARDYKI